MRERNDGRRGRSGRGDRPVGRLIAAMPAERAALLERGAGLTVRELRELAATEEGERRVRALLTAPEPGPLDTVPLDSAAMDALLDALGEDNRAALAARHLDLDVLRRMCAVPEGLAFVRALVAPVPSIAHPEVMPDLTPEPGVTGRRVATAWLLVIVGALAGVVLCMAVSVVIGGAAFLVGIIYLIVGLTVLFFKVPETRGQGPAAGLVALAFSILMVVASFSVSDWYLAVRGVPEQVTVVPPAHYRERGGDVAVCQVRYRDGSVRRVATNDAGCAEHDVGSRTTVMTDPAGWFAPHLGTAADLNLAETGSVAGAAGALLLFAPLTVVVMAAADRRKIMAADRGKRRARGDT